MKFAESLRKRIVSMLKKQIKTMTDNGSNCDDLYKQLKRWEV